MRASISIAILALCCGAAGAFASDATLAGDTTIRATMPTSNFGTLPQLEVSATANAYIQFDLGTLPTGATAANIGHATLRVFASRVSGTGALIVGTPLLAWSESALAWNGAPPASYFTSVPIAPAGEFITVDVTALVKIWVDTPAANHGFAFSTADTADVFLDSKESVTTSHPPQLQIDLVSMGPQGPQGIQGAQGTQGPRGPQGPSSLQGLTTIVSQSFTTPNGFALQMTQVCPPSYPILIGGGCGFTVGADNMSVLRNAPSSAAGAGWDCMVRNTSGADHATEVFAICAK